MASQAVRTESETRRWRPRPFGLLLAAAADFCGAVGVGNLVLGESAVGWLFAAALLLLAGISASG
jgi:hypothetical protein